MKQTNLLANSPRLVGQVLTMGFVALSLCSPSWAAVLASYDANATDPAQSPTAQGWDESWVAGSTYPPTAGSETIGGVTYRYWNLSNPSPAPNPWAVRYLDGTPAGLSSQDWTATAILRVVQAPPEGQNALFQVGDGTTLWSLNLTSTPTESLIKYIAFDGSTQLTLGSYDPSNYITLQMYFNPSTNTTGVYVNGGLIGTLNRAGSYSASSLMIRWGDNDASGRALTTESHWNVVKLETGNAVIPEPGVLGLAALGFGAVFLAVRKRFRAGSKI